MENSWLPGQSTYLRETWMKSSGTATSHLTEPNSGNTILYPR